MTSANIVRELLLSAEKNMTEIESARGDAEILLANSMNTDRADLYTHPEKEVTDEVVTKFQLLLNKRKAHYPVAYLVGNKEFWSLELEVNSHTLIPRPETERLVETALEIIPAQQTYNILDLGTGSGALALAIAIERPDATVLAVDINDQALSISRSNARKYNIMNVAFLRSDWFTELQDKQFDMIISNPPYVESEDEGFVSGEIRHEPRLALDGGQNGMQAIAHIIPAARNFLVPGGRLILEHGYKQGQDIRDLLAINHYQEIAGRRDYAGLDRLSSALRL